MIGVLIGSAALIIILSVFNGFEKVVLSLYSNFTPEIKIEARLGKTFDPNTTVFYALHRDARLFSYSEVLQEKVLIKYADKPFIGVVKGVSDEFLKNRQLDSIIRDGSFTLKADRQYYAVIGSTIQSSLGINIHSQFSPIHLYSPRRNTVSSINPMDEFIVRSIYPSGVFAIEQEFDDIVIVPIEFARELLDIPREVSSIQLNYKKGTDLPAMQADIKSKLGSAFTVRTRNEQNTELYKTLNYERWFIFMILTFVLIIATFNIIGSLTMLVIDKRKDIAILTSLGANKKLIKGIFFFEGMMISVIGCIVGIIIGLIFCILQQRFGMVKMDSKMSILDAYPIAIRITDFGLVFLTVGIIAVVASGISAQLSIKGLDDIKQDL